MTPTRDVTTPEELVAILGDPRRTRILEILTGQQASVKELSEMLDLTPQVAHYHTKRLEAAGLIEIVETREVRGTLEKFYRAVADRFVITQAIGPLTGRGLSGGLRFAQEWLQLGEHTLDRESQHVGMAGVQTIEAGREAMNGIIQRLAEVQKEYAACDGEGDRYVLVLALFPIPKDIAMPNDPSTFLQVAEDAKGVDLKFADGEGGSPAATCQP
jgi:DNA-binding transcriptional ArsR family regulator